MKLNGLFSYLCTPNRPQRTAGRLPERRPPGVSGRRGNAARRLSGAENETKIDKSMNITREQREGGVSLLSVTVGEADYAADVEKALRDYRRKANIPGFRPGMVPMGIIKKMYGKGLVAEHSYRTASNGVFEYLRKEGIDYLGDVIPSEEQGAFDFDNNTEFEFKFEIGEAPKIDLDLSEKDCLTYHRIAVDEKMRADYRSNYLRRFGRLVDVEEVSADEAITGTLDNGDSQVLDTKQAGLLRMIISRDTYDADRVEVDKQLLRDFYHSRGYIDMQVQDAYVGLISMTEEERKPFLGKKVGDKMQVNVNEIYKTPSQRAAILQVKENELEGINPLFELEITKIRKFAEPEIDEEFFKMAFPSGDVKTAEEFEKMIDGQIAAELGRESDYLFTLQLRDYLIAKAGLKMPEAFLKRWLYTINEGKFTMEDIGKDFDQFLKMFTWNYIQKHFIASEKLTVTPEEAEAEARALAAAQFAQYGMPSAPAEMLENYGKQILGNKEQSQKIYEKLFEVKVVEAVKAKIKVEEKPVSSEEFANLAKTL